jgi:hypothetical protein
MCTSNDLYDSILDISRSIDELIPDVTLVSNNTRECNSGEEYLDLDFDGCISPSFCNTSYKPGPSSGKFTLQSVECRLTASDPTRSNNCERNFDEELQTQSIDGCLIPSTRIPKVTTMRDNPSYNLYASSKVKSLRSDEFRLLKTLNRVLRSTQRTLGIDPVLPKLEIDSLVHNLQTLLSFTRRVQRTVKDLKAGLNDCTVGGLEQSASDPNEHNICTGSIPPSTHPLVP